MQSTLKLSLIFILLGNCFLAFAQQNDTESLMEQMRQEREAQLRAVEEAQALEDSPAEYAEQSSGGAPMFNVDEMLGPYRQLPPAQTKEHLREKLKGKPIVDNPKMVNFLDALIRDDRALKDVAKIIENKKKLMAFVIFNLLLFVIGYMFKKLHAAKDQKSGFGARMFRRIWRFTFMSGLRIGVFIYFFGANVSRTWDIAKHHLI